MGAGSRTSLRSLKSASEKVAEVAISSDCELSTPYVGPERGFLNLLHLLREAELMLGPIRVSISIPLLPSLSSYDHLDQDWHNLERRWQKGNQSVPPRMFSIFVVLPLEHFIELQPTSQRWDSELALGTKCPTRFLLPP